MSIALGMGFGASPQIPRGGLPSGAAAYIYDQVSDFDSLPTGAVSGSICTTADSAATWSWDGADWIAIAQTATMDNALRPATYGIANGAPLTVDVVGGDSRIFNESLGLWVPRTIGQNATASTQLSILGTEDSAALTSAGWTVTLVGGGTITSDGTWTTLTATASNGAAYCSRAPAAFSSNVAYFQGFVRVTKANTGTGNTALQILDNVSRITVGQGIASGVPTSWGRMNGSTAVQLSQVGTFGTSPVDGTTAAFVEVLKTSSAVTIWINGVEAYYSATLPGADTQAGTTALGLRCVRSSGVANLQLSVRRTHWVILA